MNIPADISSHPLAIMAVAFAALFICYFLFKKLIKLALFLILIALAVGGYYYFKGPRPAPENIIQSLREARVKSGRLLEKGKQTYQKGKDVYKKGKELTEGATEFFKKEEKKQPPEK